MKTKLAILIVLIMSLNSCKDALDMAPDGTLTVDEIFTDNDKVGFFLNSCYSYIPQKGSSYYFTSRGPTVWSDDAWDADAEIIGLASARLYNGDASASSHPVLDFGFANYSGFWTGIRNCSLLLSRIDKASVNNEADRKRWRAEAHLLRAYYYSELLKWFGAVLPIEREPYDLTADFSKVEKASYYDVVKFIIEDCDAALATNELPWRITTSAEAGRVNKGLAEAIKSKMILFAASPLYNNGKDYWQEAYQINMTSLANLKANGYELYNKVNFPQTFLSDIAFLGPDRNNYTALYNEYFNVTMSYSANPVDKETIYQSNIPQGNITWFDGIGSQDQYKTGTCPSQELVDSYETIDGQPILNLGNPYLDEKHLTPNYNSANKTYNPQDPYAKRDPRFYASIYYNGSKRNCLWNFQESPLSYENYPAPVAVRTRIIATYLNEPQTGIHPSSRIGTRTSYYQRKFLHPNAGYYIPADAANWKLFRLGEIILNFAEAAAEAGKLAEATTALNEIRTRVGMPEVPMSLPKDELIRRIRNERRVELAMEENRYFDVRRWTTPTGDLSKTDKWITAMEITRKADGTYAYNRNTVRPTDRKCYTNKFLWIPISLNEANRMKAITGKDWQNPGW